MRLLFLLPLLSLLLGGLFVDLALSQEDIAATDIETVETEDAETEDILPDDTISEQERDTIIAKANVQLVESLKIIKQNIDDLQQNVAELTENQDVEKLKITVKQLKNALNQDLSEAELKTIRKKQSKDMAAIILRFQDRIDFLEQEAVQAFGQVETFALSLKEVTDRVTIVERLQQEMRSLSEESQESQIEFYESFDEFKISNDEFKTSSESQQKDLLTLIAQQNALLKKQQKTINRQASSIKKLQKNHNALVKQLQNIVNQLSAE